MFEEIFWFAKVYFARCIARYWTRNQVDSICFCPHC